MKNNNFNYFRNNNNSSDEKKEKAKKGFFKWMKIILYLLIFGLTMTGCIQSFVLKNSTTVGNGIEFFTNKNDIAPRVNTFKEREYGNEKTTTLPLVDNDGNDTEKKLEISKLQILEQNADKNIYVNDREILSKLREQTTENGGQYGVETNGQKIFLSAINIESQKDNNNRFIVEKNGRYLFKSANSTSYKYVNDIDDIVLLRFLPNTAIPYIDVKKHKIDVKSADSKKTIQKDVYNVDSKGNLSVNFISGLQLVNNYNEKDENITNVNDKITIANFMFARDVLQEFYNYTFGKNSKFLSDLNKYTINKINDEDFTSVSEYFKSLIKDDKKVIVAQDSDETLFEVSQPELTLIRMYQETMLNYLNSLGFVEKRKDKNDPKSVEQSKIISSNINKYNFEESKLNVINKELLFRGDYPLQPISNWAQSWEYGPFYGLIVYPLSVVVQSLQQSLPDLKGWEAIIAIVISLVLTRLIALALTFKTKMSQSLQEGLRYKKAAIEAKYQGFEKNKQMKMRKNQEIQALYAKYNINPLDQFGSLLISMPIFLAMWRVIQGIPEIKDTVWLGLNFSSVSFQKVMGGDFSYLWILVLTIAIQILSQLLPQFLNRKKFKRTTTISEKNALKKSEKTQKIMVAVFAIITIMFGVGVQIYWLFGGLWQMLEVLSLHKLKKTKWFKEKYSKKLARKS
ncbi:membrane protein insertase YidC [Mycoplasma sp. CSL7491-lung]|uniref:membrane protein insertase YidC n=1 Tax=Mycoplasma sp. CSL7491-lung TaxID=549718 RepID=UPI001C0F6F7B|nr:membrane protein insertase YidC [Mycoplasma sp. CSL7491-lung]MBU4693199.1 membrane protein insertase YidC [Mycoplasma sp. CSL7491-lung]